MSDIFFFLRFQKELLTEHTLTAPLTLWEAHIKVGNKMFCIFNKLKCFNECVDMMWLQDGDNSQVEGVLSPPSPLGFVRMVHSSVHTGSSSDVFLSTLEFDGIYEIYLINTTRWKWHMWDSNQLHGALTPDSIFWMCWSESEPQR